MTSKDWFGVVVRTIGLWSLIQATSQFLGVFTIMGGFFDGLMNDPSILKSGGTTGALMFIVLEFGIGFLLLRKADTVVDFAFPPRRNEFDSTTQR